jgi:hypothetical protein
VDKDIYDKKLGKALPMGKICSNCQSPEGSALKHKICSACKTRFYCSVDCQRADWKGGHKEVCKMLAAKK